MILFKNVDFILLISICIQKIKVRYQSSQETLKIQQYSNLVGWEHALAYPFQNNRLRLFLLLTSETNKDYSILWLAESISSLNLRTTIFPRQVVSASCTPHITQKHLRQILPSLSMAGHAWPHRTKSSIIKSFFSLVTIDMKKT